MTVDYGIDGELLVRIRLRAAEYRKSHVYDLAASDRQVLLNMIAQLLTLADDQAAALCLLQDGIGDIRTEIIKDM